MDAVNGSSSVIRTQQFHAVDNMKMVIPKAFLILKSEAPSRYVVSLFPNIVEQRSDDDDRRPWMRFSQNSNKLRKRILPARKAGIGPIIKNEEMRIELRYNFRHLWLT